MSIHKILSFFQIWCSSHILIIHINVKSNYVSFRHLIGYRAKRLELYWSERRAYFWDKSLP